MKMTLLEIVQNILSAMDAEEVNSISDTIESLQVADEVKTTYYANLGAWEIASRFSLIQFTANGDTTNHPNVMAVADGVDHFEWIKYNVQTTADPKYEEMEYMEPKDFLEWVTQNETGTLVTVKDVTTDAPYQIRSDKNPERWTSFDDVNIVFDSYNSDYDSSLQSSKVLAYGESIPSWTASDTFTPDLQTKYFPLLLAEAKAASFINYKGVSSSKEEQRSRQLRVRLQDNSRRYNGSPIRTDFGRS